MPKSIIKGILSITDKFKRKELEVIDRLLDFKWIRFVAVALLSLLVTSFTTLSVQSLPDEMEEGAVATRDIKADRNYEIIDREATDKARQEAIETVLSVYDFDEEMADQVANRIESAFAFARKKLDEFQKAKSSKRRKRRAIALTQDEGRDLRSNFESQLGLDLSEDEWRSLIKDGFSRRTGLAVAHLVRESMTRPIIAERGALADEKDQGITIRRIRKAGDEMVVDKEWRVSDPKTIQSTGQVREKLRTTKTNPQVIMDLAESMIEPNLFFDRAETELRRKQVSDSVKNSIIKIKAGEMIIRNGSRYDKRHLKLLKEIQNERVRGTFSREFLGTWLLTLMILLIPFILARRYIKRFSPSRVDYFLMGVIGLVVLAMMRIMIVMLPAIREAFFMQVPPNALNYMIPVAGGAMLLRMLFNTETTLIFTLVMSMCAALFIQTDIQFATFVLLSSIAGMIVIAHVDRRTMIMRAGLITGLVNIFVVIGIRLMGMVSMTEALPASGLAWCGVFAFVGGLGNAVFVMIAAPMVESLMNYTTDIKLLELANLNHPLLRELIVSAPGTYHHSHLVGILGEAAAESIGANALLVRVGAYYHDIGKMRKPPYFIENARNGENRHEKLTPSMSALIVQAHVKDGIEMAQSARLPKVIIDMIPQHHGTRMISFFYEKAKSQEKPEIQKIDPKDFKYPGPKPQTREAAILMLADVVEAQVRSLKEKSSARIEQTVRKIIDDVFREAQLDECELTLKDLDDIHKAFVRILLGIYHQRIEYPEKEKTERSRENMGSGTAATPAEAQGGAKGIASSGARKKDGE